MQENIHDEAVAFTEVNGDHFELIQRLKSTGLFSDRLLQLVEDELRLLAVKNRTSGHVSELRPGDQVGRFIVDELLAQGGEGFVFRGHDSMTQEAVAIKILNNFRMCGRFRREMELVLQLAHPNIVTAYEVSQFQAVPFIAMELLPGPDLATLVRERGPLDWLCSSRFVLQISRALAHAHDRELMHRDIKPGNIILSDRNDVKLVDLGLASVDRACGETARFDETQDVHIAGTLPFMAPEQARSASSFQSDIYSLGATWFYLLTAELRLPGHSLAEQFANLLIHRRFNELPPDRLPPALYQIYQCMVSYEAMDRYADCYALTAELEEALLRVGEPVTEDTICVLVVEDSRTDMHRTIEVLRRTNQSLSIHKARTLAEGIETCHNVRADLVVLDLNLPDCAGVETLQRFRRWEPDIPIVVLTGSADTHIHDECMKSGGTSFMSKVELTAHSMERVIFVTFSRSGFCRDGSD